VLGVPRKSYIEKIKATLDTFDLAVSGISGMWGTRGKIEGSRLRTNLISTNPSFAKSGLEYAKHCLEMCRLVDGNQVNVCLTSDYQSISTYQLTHGFKLSSEKRHILESRVIPMLTELTRIAKDNDVKLLLEPLNRYCSRFCNTAKEAVDIAKRVNHDSFGILLDTYHMNIEESSIEAAIQNSGEWLRHTHFADNNRKMPGYGHIEFDSIIKSLKKVGHDEYICFEPNLSLADFKDATKRGLDFIKRIEYTYS
jgi:D-psicose/D-tagatose/L-ribulose 3-epimerase